MPFTNNKGFTLIEVIVGLVILASAIILAASTFKQFSMLKEKQDKYQKIYISVLSLKDKIYNFKDINFVPLSGSINGLSYNITIQQIAQKNLYFQDSEFSGKKRALFLLTLYKITINIGGEDFVFYKTTYRKI